MRPRKASVRKDPRNPTRPWVQANWLYCSDCGTLHPVLTLDEHRWQKPEECKEHSGDDWRALRWRPSTGHRNYFWIDRPADHTDCYYCDRAKETWETELKYKRRTHEHTWWVCIRCWGVKFGSRWG